MMNFLHNGIYNKRIDQVFPHFLHLQSKTEFEFIYIPLNSILGNNFFALLKNSSFVKALFAYASFL